MLRNRNVNTSFYKHVLGRTANNKSVFIFVDIQKATNTLNLLTNPICQISMFYFSYLIIIFFSLANKYLLTYLHTYPNPYFKANRKTNYLAIIDDAIYQYICRYILLDTTHLPNIFIIIYVSTVLRAVQKQLCWKYFFAQTNNHNRSYFIFTLLKIHRSSIQQRRI